MLVVNWVYIALFSKNPSRNIFHAYEFLNRRLRKTIVSENIVKGTLSLKNEGKGKLVVANNADDSPSNAEL